jgi:hypothetical protein
MKNTTVRRLEILEEEERFHERLRKASLGTYAFLSRKIVLAYYLGNLQPHEHPSDAEARALQYPSCQDYLEALFEKDKSEIRTRLKKAYGRLFAQVGLSFDRSSPRVLLHAFIELVRDLPEPWLRWLTSELQACRPRLAKNFASGLASHLGGDPRFLFGDLLPSCRKMT